MRGDPISIGEWTSLKTLPIPFSFHLNNLCWRLSELPIPSHKYPADFGDFGLDDNAVLLQDIVEADMDQD